MAESCFSTNPGCLTITFTKITSWRFRKACCSQWKSRHKGFCTSLWSFVLWNLYNGNGNCTHNRIFHVSFCLMLQMYILVYEYECKLTLFKYHVTNVYPSIWAFVALSSWEISDVDHSAATIRHNISMERHALLTCMLIWILPPFHISRLRRMTLTSPRPASTCCKRIGRHWLCCNEVIATVCCEGAIHDISSTNFFQIFPWRCEQQVWKRYVGLNSTGHLYGLLIFFWEILRWEVFREICSSAPQLILFWVWLPD
jgi:hypothetical protein